MSELDQKVLDLAQHCRDRCGWGFGKYPVGVRYAIGQLLPMVNVDTHGTNGYGEATKSIGQLIAEIDLRITTA